MADSGTAKPSRCCSRASESPAVPLFAINGRIIIPRPARRPPGGIPSTRPRMVDGILWKRGMKHLCRRTGNPPPWKMTGQSETRCRRLPPVVAGCRPSQPPLLGIRARCLKGIDFRFRQVRGCLFHWRGSRRQGIRQEGTSPDPLSWLRNELFFIPCDSYDSLFPQVFQFFPLDPDGRENLFRVFA